MNITKELDGKRVLCVPSYSEWFQKEKPEFYEVWFKVCKELDPSLKMNKIFFHGGLQLGYPLLGVRVRLRLTRRENNIRMHGEVTPQDVNVHFAPFVHWCLEEDYSDLM